MQGMDQKFIKNRVLVVAKILFENSVVVGQSKFLQMRVERASFYYYGLVEAKIYVVTRSPFHLTIEWLALLKGCCWNEFGLESH